MVELRACSPDETYAKVLPSLSELGITRVACQTGLDRIGIPVWAAYAPNARAIVVSQGKGLDDGAARISAVMEAVERIVATEPGCDRLSSTVLLHSRQGNRIHTLDSLIARHQPPLDIGEEIEWVKAVSLFDGGPVFLPFGAIDFDRTRRSPRFWQSSDGLASGNTWDEAVLHGLLERVERDALALWSVTSAGRRFIRRIDPTRSGSEKMVDLLSKIERAGLQIALFDITSDLQIPAMAALVGPRDLDQTVRYVDLTLGAGAALAAEGAAFRAILEAVQSRMTFISGARDDVLPSVFTRSADPSHVAAFRARSTVDFDDIVPLNASDTGMALDHLVEVLTRRGIFELFAVDISWHSLPVRVAKVFAPQLESLDGARRIRFGPRALSRSFQ